MKIFTSLLFLFAASSSFGQKPTAFEKHAADSLKEQLLGEWYLTGIYTFDLNAKQDYVSAPDGSFSIRITSDSITFNEPLQRFYKPKDNRFRFKVSFKDRYQGQTIDLYKTKSKKEIPHEFHFELIDDELLLTEEVQPVGFSQLGITKQYVFNRYFDSQQLETKLQYTWSTNDVKELDLSKAPDTIVFTKVLKAYDRKNYEIQIYREPGWLLTAKINLFQHSSENEGILIRETGNLILHPKDQKIELMTSQGRVFFRVLSIDDDQLILVRTSL